MKNKLVSIVISTRNSAKLLEDCLKSIKNQSYKNIEIIIIDSFSSDSTIKLAENYNCKIYQYQPKVEKGKFETPYKRNYGVKKAKGYYVYYVDADMKLTSEVIKEAVKSCENGFSAVIVREDSFGEGVWAKAKNLERRCYWGDDSIEAPRFCRKDVWEKLGGLDETLGGGGDDWDFYQKLLENNYKVGRIKTLVLHNESNLKLSKLFLKRFMYGRDTLKYLSKRPIKGIESYFPIRKAYIRNWKLFIKRPVDTLYFIIMRSIEYFAGLGGIMYSFIKRKNE